MNINQNLLQHLQKLANLSLSADLVANTEKNLNEIINFAKNLDELDLEDIPASSHAMDITSPFREDIPNTDDDIPKMVLKNAPKSEEGFFVVPKIIE